MSSRPMVSIAIAACLVVVAASSAVAAPRLVRVSWTDSDTATTATVTWQSDAAADPSMLEFGTTPAFDGVAEGTSELVTGTLGAVHEVQLTGLEPATEYYYRAGGPGGWSPTYTFRTGQVDGCEPFRFIALGDNRDDLGWGPSLHWNSVIGEAFDHQPAFIVNTGDLVHDGDDDQQWLHYLEATDERMATFPMLPSLGNHDDDKVEGDAALYNKLFAMPRNDVSGTEDYYFFTYGDAIFVALSTQTFQGGTQLFGEQAEWLDQVLTDHPKTWKFVYFHHPIYTGVLGAPFFELNHPPNEQGQNALWVPLFDKHHVDVVFNGHNHFYQRFAPLCCGGGADEGQAATSAATGTTYVVTGGGGATTYDIPFVPELICASSPYSEVCSGKHHYVLAEVAGNTLHLEVWTAASQLFSNTESNIELIDEWTIVKDLPAPDCSGEPDPAPDADPAADAGPVADEGSAVAEEPPSVAEEPGPVAEPVEDAAVAGDAGVGEEVGAEIEVGPGPGAEDGGAVAPGDGSGAPGGGVADEVAGGGPDAADPAATGGGTAGSDGSAPGAISTDSTAEVAQHDAGGCVAGGAAGAPFALVGLLLLFARWWRRRRRPAARGRLPKAG